MTTLSVLEEFARKIADQPAELSQVIFNNNFEDQGQRNARTLTEILEQMPRAE